MERELWAVLSAAVFGVARARRSGPRFTHDTALVARVYLWAVLHDRPTSWACRASSWSAAARPPALPSQSTMSRRLRTQETAVFLDAVSRRLGGGRGDGGLLKIIDAKPLAVGVYSGDKQAAWGRGVRGFHKGYKLFCLWGEGAMPLAWSVAGMSTSEVAMAAGLLASLRGGGYVLGDRLYDCAPLYDLAMSRNHQLVAPRKRPGAGVSPRAASPHRLRAMGLLRGAFGQALYARRTDIERRFGAMASFGGGMFSLPPWVRTLGRVRRYVHAKLPVNAARIRVRENAAA